MTAMDIAMTDAERAREVTRLVIEALRLSDTRRLAVIHHLLGPVAIEAAREARASMDPDARASLDRDVRAAPDPDYPPGVVPLRVPWPG
jgi:hypothetical protein